MRISHPCAAQVPSFDELGAAPLNEGLAMATEKRLNSLLLDSIEDAGKGSSGLKLERPKTAFQWFIGFYVPAFVRRPARETP